MYFHWHNPLFLVLNREQRNCIHFLFFSVIIIGVKKQLPVCHIMWVFFYCRDGETMDWKKSAPSTKHHLHNLSPHFCWLEKGNYRKFDGMYNCTYIPIHSVFSSGVIKRCRFLNGSKSDCVSINLHPKAL